MLQQRGHVLRRKRKPELHVLRAPVAALRGAAVAALPFFAWSAVLAACSPSVHDRAVVVTAQSGIRLAQDAPAMGTRSEICAQKMALHLAHQCPTDSEGWIRAVGVLVTYSRAIDRLANDGQPSTAGQDVELASLSNPRDANVERLAKLVLGLLTEHAKSEALRSAVKAANPSIQLVATDLLAHIKVEREALSTLRCRVDCDAGIGRSEDDCPDNPPECVASDDAHAIQFAAASSSLQERDDRLVRAAEDISAFARAHATLNEKMDTIPDEELRSILLHALTHGAELHDGGGLSVDAGSITPTKSVKR